ncbi:MAG TPA: ABC transporter substrate-binding protein [Pararhizobium sp.]|uniref:ABC transporter substrate-binding protein n=1 Tax=Pararhizobium sp. TaxID=1977563 RepID=UPI002C586D81|nr:ABC transporter substrate-binding protein [Pararhizobium sp.]HTO34320.1 ABC transporter substrate-binding protein [Pararhizobium sp.]
MNYLKIGSICTLIALCATPVTARDFTIAAWGGNYQDAQREAYFKPFMKEHGLKFVETTYLGGLAELKAMADTGNVTWDLVMAGGTDAQMACDEGLLEEVSWDALGGGKDLLPAAVQPCAVGNVVIGNGFAYNAEMFPNAPPQDWADFFNLEKFPGKRGMINNPNMNLEYALMADGVPLDKVYEMLSTPEGVDRAFAKMDTIKAQLQFWEAGSQPVEWLVAKNVAMSSGYNGRIITAKHEGKPLEFVWKNHIYNIDVWAVPKGAPYKEQAMEFMKFANNAEAQAKFSAAMPYGPTNVNAIKLMSEADAKDLPVGDNIAEALPYSDAFWVENYDTLKERWSNWVVQ